MQTDSVLKNFGILLDTCVSSDAKIGMVVGVPIEGMVNRLAVIKTRKESKPDKKILDFMFVIYNSLIRLKNQGFKTVKYNPLSIC